MAYEAILIETKQEGVVHRKKKSTIQYSVNDATHRITVILLGESMVGKTSMICRYFEDTFYRDQDRTQGIAQEEKIIAIINDIIHYQVMDTAGQERHSPTLGNTFYRQAHGCLLVFDVTNRTSFIQVKSWLQSLRQGARDNVVIFLVGTKVDKIEDDGCQRQVTEQEAQQFVKDNKIKKYFETSSLTGHGIDSVFQTMAAYIIQYLGDAVKVRSGIVNLNEQPGNPKQKKGCSCTML